MNNKPNQEKREKWKAIIEEQERSGLSQEEFCKQHNLSPSSLAYYRRIYRHKSHQPKKVLGSFAQVNISKPTSINEIRLSLPNGFQCAIPCELDGGQIKELIGILLSC